MIQREGEPQELANLTELNRKSGFVIAPFAVTHQQPVLLLHPDEQQQMELGEVDSVKAEIEEMITANEESYDRSHAFYKNGEQPLSGDMARMRYRIDFANFHAHLCDGAFRKIVLARSTFDKNPENKNYAADLFCMACRLYPRMFVSLVSTKKSGTWMMATPEILLDGKGTDWRTIALAGTMKLENHQLGFDSIGDGIEDRSNGTEDRSDGTEDRSNTAEYLSNSTEDRSDATATANADGHQMSEILWDQKNIQEQRYVATYITECLERFSHRMQEEGPYTVRAANLVHLRSDFNFQLDDCSRIGTLLKALHPTPAVCGLPKDDTFDFIIHNESSPRTYYSGFTGMLNPEAGTHLYVSLRCMHIRKDGYMLYAGGGLLADSIEEQEWEETEAKMETMRNIIYRAR